MTTDNAIETTAIAIRDVADEMRPVFNAQQARARVAEVQAFVKDAMIEDVHYGKIAGGNKPTLLKPGAELLNEIYGLACDFTVEKAVEDWNAPFFHYRIKCTLTSLRTGTLRGAGFGQYASGAPGALASRWIKKNGDPQDLAFIANAVLKMAEKSAHIDATLKVTQSSGILTQDMEDFDSEDTGNGAMGSPAPASLGTCPDGHPLKEGKYGLQCTGKGDQYPKGWHNWKPPKPGPMVAESVAPDTAQRAEANAAWKRWATVCAENGWSPLRLRYYLGQPNATGVTGTMLIDWRAAHPDHGYDTLIALAVEGEMAQQEAADAFADPHNGESEPAPQQAALEPAP